MVLYIWSPLIAAAMNPDIIKLRKRIKILKQIIEIKQKAIVKYQRNIKELTKLAHAPE